MRFIYGEMNILRALEEAEFWKRQESEHTVVIQEVVPDLEEEYVNKLIEYKEIFDSTESRITQYIENIVNNQNISPRIYEDNAQLINLAIKQSQVFINFLSMLLRESDPVMNDPISTTVINHIRRESEYFIGIVSAFLDLLMQDTANKRKNFY
ncbi:DUF2935 domain-containing protein [Sedimentibacter sp. MB31-C6]|uniref:DUF2935 domain-containing protein n=1 Tax=Sedimentibacter sp. MB31-C6 TaxID=3109366 RepID=UPI002DDD1288|nr:DUF2935 domain-containing protein [Sedimentibacter sp. MB36-C1]WSI04319.1 DUF2935 domain-containing protein [Sedimentibacter sp. MB36-C1]